MKTSNSQPLKCRLLLLMTVIQRPLSQLLVTNHMLVNSHQTVIQNDKTLLNFQRGTVTIVTTPQNHMPWDLLIIFNRLLAHLL